MSAQLSIPEAETTALTRVETLSLTTAFAPGGIEAIVGQIEREVRAIKRDISTPTSRKAIKSLAFKVARSKTAIDDLGKQANESKRAEINAVDADRRIARDRLDALKAEVLSEVEAWEASEAAKIKAHEDALGAIVEHPDFGMTETAADLLVRLIYLRTYPKRDWDTFAQRAADTLAAEITRTERLHEAAVKREADAAELVRLQAEEAERARLAAIAAQEARERQIAQEAAEQAKLQAEAAAEQLRVAAEQKAEAERQAGLRREQEAREATERAEKQARQAEADRIEAERRAETERLAAEERAREREAALTRQAEEQAIEAVAAEQRRAAAAIAQAESEAAKRAANVAHQKRINGEALADLMKVEGMTEALCKAVITAAAKGHVRHVGVTY